MNELTVQGKQKFMGKDIPVVVGGFGANKRCMCDKTVAHIHNMKPIHVRELISSNISRFKNDIEYIDLAQRIGEGDTLILLNQLGYSQQSIVQSNHIYILSERGYAKLIKIMDSDRAWKIYDQLLDEYFTMREEKRTAAITDYQAEKLKCQQERNEIARKNAEIKALSEKNKTAKLMQEELERAGVAPSYRVLAFQDFFSEEGFKLPAGAVTVPKKFYDATTIADRLGVLSKSDKPHAQAITAIIKLVGVNDGESVRVPCISSHSGHADTTLQYSDVVVSRVENWLEENNYPTVIRGLNGKEYNIYYKLAA